MITAETTIQRSPARCWASFTDARLLVAWVPGLKSAKVVLLDDGGRPLEVLFGFNGKLTYSLVYRYDAERRRVEWVPGLGKKDAVSGFAQFAEHDGGATRMTYGVEVGSVREAGADPELLAQAFAKWVESGPR